MKSIKHPGNFLLACVMAVVCLICLSVCLFFRMDGELLAVGFYHRGVGCHRFL